MTQQCARTCNRCMPALIQPASPPPPITGTRRAQGVLKISEICLTSMETALRGLELVLQALVKYIRAARLALKEASDALKQASPVTRRDRVKNNNFNNDDYEF
ncbi:hypothetical protein AAVH_26952 [Aphelenchoides avenae]|nr:hypothetical protein AAVH_26952 [Aphelenchus avenae]